MPVDAPPTPPQFMPVNPGFAEKVHETFARQGMMQAMGARIVSLSPGRCSITLPYASAVSQQQSFFHGGAIGAIADNACGIAAYTLMPEQSEVLTVEYKINLVKAARPPLVRADGLVMRAGRTITVCRAEVFRIDGDTQELCAVMQATIMRLELAKA